MGLCFSCMESEVALGSLAVLLPCVSLDGFPCGFDGFSKPRNVEWHLAFVPQQIEESKHISDEE